MSAAAVYEPRPDPVQSETGVLSPARLGRRFAGGADC